MSRIIRIFLAFFYEDYYFREEAIQGHIFY